MSAWLMLVSGFEGIPLPYSPRTDDVIALVLLAVSSSRPLRWHGARSFFLNKQRTLCFIANVQVFLLPLRRRMSVICCCWYFRPRILSGICIFNYFNDVQPTLMEKVSPPLLLGIYILICLLYLLLKWLFYSFLGWVFFDKNRTTIWLESYSTLIYYLGFVLFPFVLLLVYFDLNILFLVSIGLFLIIFAKILMFYKWIKLFR